ncbi:MAG: cupin domain-containing protein [Oscillospiraceae bacterium]|nr:cupin domain-containing protein [Oscillospiraceae bacterium]
MVIKKKDGYPLQLNEKMRGGEGVVTVENLLTPAEMNDKGRLYAKLTLGPGSSIGYHVHEGEMESFFIVRGEARITDGNETVALLPGDTALTPAGEGHSIRNSGESPLEIIALILYR